MIAFASRPRASIYLIRYKVSHKLCSCHVYHITPSDGKVILVKKWLKMCIKILEIYLFKCTSFFKAVRIHILSERLACRLGISRVLSIDFEQDIIVRCSSTEHIWFWWFIMIRPSSALLISFLWSMSQSHRNDRNGFFYEIIYMSILYE